MMKILKILQREEGFFQFFGIILIGLLVFTGLAYMKWGADEAYEATVEHHRLQAYYAAHAGIMDLGFKSLRSLSVADIPNEPAYLGRSNLVDDTGNNIAYADVFLQPNPNTMGTAFSDTKALEFLSHGVVEFKGVGGEIDTVSDNLSLQVRILGLNHFFYLTDHETTPFGEVIKFWGQDTLEGWVHSNDTIAIMENPVFYDRVTTVAPVFWQGLGYNPQFVNYDPVFNYREIYLPTEATQIREAAAAYGNFFDSENGYYAHRLVFNDRQGWTMFRWPMGTPFDSLTATVFTGPVPAWEAIYVDGYLELYGTVRGQVTVGATGHPIANEFLGKHCIRLLDDVKYWFSSPVNGSFNDTTGGYTDILGIVSESNITIANTYANGRENQSQGSSIIITAAMIALGDDSKSNYWGSFSFEDQNEPPPNPTIWEFYTGDYYAPGTGPDERGDIYLWGAVTQRRRGYVHRSNHNGTGYGKDYHFDDRLKYMAPPYFLEATDSEGNAFWQIVKWGDLN
jgi:hypothetical protein